jgi:signal transduction histidine kinase
LLSLINEILDLSKIESGHINLSLEEVCLKDALFESIQLITPLSEKRAINIQIKINGMSVKSDEQYSQIEITVDKTRLKQILLNLLSNAVKYNNDNGSITINCDESFDEQILRLRITNTGMGLSKEQQKSIFKPFERLGAEQTLIEGTGIGLLITKKIIEQMGGRIGVESKLNESCTFWIEFPYDKPMA